MGVLVAQALTVLLGITVVIFSLALLALVSASARRRELRAARVVMTPACGNDSSTDLSIRSVIDHKRAAPSRAPPTFYLQARWDDSADASAG
jgi:hypothetical protein